MKKILILMLGKGQLTKNNNNYDYKKAIYFKEDEPEKSKESPFVAEAIISFYPGYYDKVYIVGTSGSMWDILYNHCIEKNNKLDEETYSNIDLISENLKNETIDKKTLKLVAEEFSFMNKVETECLKIDMGKNKQELWQIFSDISDLILQNEKNSLEISFDITHGLRHQPFFLLLCLNYLRVIRRDIKFGNVFYGAMELQKYFEDKVPVINLKPIIEIFDWIASARAFRDYSDIRPLIELIKNQETNEQINEFIREAEKYSANIQLNDFNALSRSAGNLISKLKKLNEQKKDELIPLKLVSDIITEFPEKIKNSKLEQWKLMLELSENHFEKGQTGYAIISLWEAMINRFAEIYGVNPKEGPAGNNYYTRLSNLIKSSRLKDSEFSDFHFHSIRISHMRNFIAHIDFENLKDANIKPENLNKEFEKSLQFLKKALYHDNIANIRNNYFKNLP